MIEYKLFEDEYKIYFDRFDADRRNTMDKRVTLENYTNHKVKQIINLCFALNQAELFLDEKDLNIIICDMTTNEIKQLAEYILPKHGEVFDSNFLIRNSESPDLAQLAHYFLRYALGLDDHDYNLEIEYEFKDPKNARQLTFLKEEDLVKKLNSICMNISNPTNKDLRIIELFHDKINPSYINNKSLLHKFINLKYKNTDELKKFLNSYKCKTPNDILQIIEAFESKIIIKRVPRYPQYLKTFIVKSVDKLARLNYQQTIDFITRYRKKWQKIQFCVTTTHKRYACYKNAQNIFNLILQRNYKDNSLAKLNCIKFKCFEENFEAYYNYNTTFAYMNIVKLLKKYNFPRIDDNLFVKKPPTSSRSIIQAIIGIFKMLENNHAKSYFFNESSYIKECNPVSIDQKQKENIAKILVQLDQLFEQQIAQNAANFKL